METVMHEGSRLFGFRHDDVCKTITEGKEKSDDHKDFMFTLCIYRVFYPGPDL